MNNTWIGPWFTVLSGVWKNVTHHQGYQRLQPAESEHLLALLTRKLNRKTDDFLKDYAVSKQGSYIVTTDPVPGKAAWDTKAQQELAKLLFDEVQPIVAEWIVSPESNHRGAGRE